MGVDPGAANLGFGVVRVEGAHMVALDGGVIETSPSEPPERRLSRIHNALSELIEWHEPKALALEELFFNRNVASAMVVGQACGVSMLAAGQRGVECFTYTPQAIKLAVCGSGSAGKKQVARLVSTLLRLPEPPSSEHAADALAVAICHAGMSEATDEIKLTRTEESRTSERRPNSNPGTPGSEAEDVPGLGVSG